MNGPLLRPGIRQPGGDPQVNLAPLPWASRLAGPLRSPASMKVLVVIPGALGERMSAPEVRGWNMALELRRRHEVLIAAPAPESGSRDGIPLIPSQRQLLIRAARSADVVVAPRIPPYLYAALASRPTLLVADMYNPEEVEQAHGGDGIESRMHLDLIRANDSLQLQFADIVLCAVDALRGRPRHRSRTSQG